jgi:hypothetical protein
VLPEYPLQPAAREILPAFAMSGHAGTRYVDRFRALLIPPVTGEYVFWIASDDSSELWLSADADPAHAQKIASAERWTEIDEWSRLPTQRSGPIVLTALRPYYIEAIREQNLGAAHLSVAWQGPGIERRIIPGEHLAPFRSDAAPAAGHGQADTKMPGAGAGSRTPPAAGVLREVWPDQAVRNVAALEATLPDAHIFQLQDAAIEVIQSPAPWPAPLALVPATFELPRDAYRFMEVRGTVRFASCRGPILALELEAENLILAVTVSDWPAQRRPPEPGAIIRARGVCEPARLADTSWIAGRFLVPGSDALELVSPSAQWDAIPKVELSALPA